MIDSKMPARRSGRSHTAVPTGDAPATGEARRSRRKADSATTFTSDERNRMVRTAAYYRAERRGFAAGHEADDWLAAEAEVDALMVSAPRTRARKPRTN